MAFDPDRWTSTTPLEVLIAPATTTTRGPSRARPRRWPSNTDVAALRRDRGHDDSRTPRAVRAATNAAPPTVRRHAQGSHHGHVTPLYRARLALLAVLLPLMTAALAVPHMADAARGSTTQPAPAGAAASTTPCSPVEVGCCPATPGPVDMVRELRPACP